MGGGTARAVVGLLVLGMLGGCGLRHGAGHGPAHEPSTGSLMTARDRARLAAISAERANDPPEGYRIGPDDVYLSFLPLSHVFERMAGFYTMMTAGTSIAYAESFETVPENLREIGPTIVCSVPRVYEKMYARMIDTVSKSPAPRRALFWWAVRVGAKHMRAASAGRIGPWLSLQHRVAHADQALVDEEVALDVGAEGSDVAAPDVGLRSDRGHAQDARRSATGDGRLIERHRDVKHVQVVPAHGEDPAASAAREVSADRGFFHA